MSREGLSVPLDYADDAVAYLCMLLVRPVAEGETTHRRHNVPIPGCSGYWNQTMVIKTDPEIPTIECSVWSSNRNARSAGLNDLNTITKS